MSEQQEVRIDAQFIVTDDNCLIIDFGNCSISNWKLTATNVMELRDALDEALTHIKKGAN